MNVDQIDKQVKTLAEINDVLQKSHLSPAEKVGALEILKSGLILENSGLFK